VEVGSSPVISVTAASSSGRGFAVGVDRSRPVPFPQQRNGGVFAAGDGPADRELAAHSGVAQRAEVREERLGAASSISPDQDRVPVSVGIRDLGQGLVEYGDVVGGRIRPGVARPQEGGKELAGVVAEGEQRVVAEAVLVLCTR
jgi:hypothetical protein